MGGLGVGGWGVVGCELCGGEGGGKGEEVGGGRCVWGGEGRGGGVGGGDSPTPPHLVVGPPVLRGLLPRPSLCSSPAQGLSGKRWDGIKLTEDWGVPSPPHQSAGAGRVSQHSNVDHLQCSSRRHCTLPSGSQLCAWWRSLHRAARALVAAGRWAVCKRLCTCSAVATGAEVGKGTFELHKIHSQDLSARIHPVS